MAGTAVPQEVLGLAVFVDVLSVLATVLVVGLIRHVDFTLNWRTIQIQRFENERHHSYSDSDMFGKADVGWRLVLSWTSIFTYNVDALLVLFCGYLPDYRVATGNHSTPQIPPKPKPLHTLLPEIDGHVNLPRSWHNVQRGYNTDSDWHRQVAHIAMDSADIP
ncbi:hypothetical protein SLS56_005660 [Neofusicoccum ribis]|uniref:Uncharacterized protein n=1 Tax=Neofusicoccum ribis TaxID=45134 RepID=A0ABR3SU15_9PEZI